jgi:hypothetical protein
MTRGSASAGISTTGLRSAQILVGLFLQARPHLTLDRDPGTIVKSVCDSGKNPMPSVVGAPCAARPCLVDTEHDAARQTDQAS